MSFTFGTWPSAPADPASPEQPNAPAAGPSPEAAARPEPSPGAEDFVARYAHAWSAPALERLGELLHPEAELSQPLQPTARGRAQVTELWRALLEAVPDLTGEVLSWAARDGVVFIELRLRGRAGNRAVEWVTADRITLEDGRARRWAAYFDPLPLARALSGRPKALVNYARGLRARRR